MTESNQWPATPGTAARCERCGHQIMLHGRRGYGACRVGRAGPLAAAVAAARYSVCVGATDAEVGENIKAAFANARRCECKRFAMRPIHE